MTAHAEWKYISSNDTFDVYIDNSRTKTEGGYKLVWDLLDYKSPQTTIYTGKVYKSRVIKSVIDCPRSRLQTIGFYVYADQMGKGVVVELDNFPIQESGWQSDVPNTLGYEYINMACGRK